MGQNGLDCVPKEKKKKRGNEVSKLTEHTRHKLVTAIDFLFVVRLELLGYSLDPVHQSFKVTLLNHCPPPAPAR